MSTQMTIELSAEKPRKHEFYRATLDLPATDLQIEDALSKARFQNESSKKYIDIEEAILFDPSHLSVTADDIHALNYLAKRLDSLSEEDEIKFEALYYARTRGMQEDEQIQVGSVINKFAEVQAKIWSARRSVPSVVRRCRIRQEPNGRCRFRRIL
jgi:hypothetical protein